MLLDPLFYEDNDVGRLNFVAVWFFGFKLTYYKLVKRLYRHKEKETTSGREKQVVVSYGSTCSAPRCPLTSCPVTHRRQHDSLGQLADVQLMFARRIVHVSGLINNCVKVSKVNALLYYSTCKNPWWFPVTFAT